ncbi:hypothetical protein B0H13DRAFT_2453014 [Mycena leptocephala]|nr:hypothetical protein B0H13DRAFT_2453014 [Mycena leptocephala]
MSSLQELGGPGKLAQGTPPKIKLVSITDSNKIRIDCQCFELWPLGDALSLFKWSKQVEMLARARWRIDKKDGITCMLFFVSHLLPSTSTIDKPLSVAPLSISTTIAGLTCAVHCAFIPSMPSLSAEAVTTAEDAGDKIEVPNDDGSAVLAHALHVQKQDCWYIARPPARFFRCLLASSRPHSLARKSSWPKVPRGSSGIRTFLSNSVRPMFYDRSPLPSVLRLRGLHINLSQTHHHQRKTIPAILQENLLRLPGTSKSLQISIPTMVTPPSIVGTGEQRPWATNRRCTPSKCSAGRHTKGGPTVDLFGFTAFKTKLGRVYRDIPRMGSVDFTNSRLRYCQLMQTLQLTSRLKAMTVGQDNIQKICVHYSARTAGFCRILGGRYFDNIRPIFGQYTLYWLSLRYFQMNETDRIPDVGSNHPMRDNKIGCTLARDLYYIVVV